ncbi:MULTISPECIES: TetR/AcrR family transcriptional regulator [Bacillaceae]|uniref:TetR/AcrR family transcriptional regulator n=1 Tax=Bacillaceae TaxID=186817 RepID=UPI002FFD8875
MSEKEDLLVGDFPFVPKQERAQQKRNALIESGRVLFVTKGYEQTTAKEIAAHAGVATGTFYRYFSDKRQLLMSLLEDKIERFLPPEPSWSTQDPVTLLATLLEGHAKHLKEWGLQRVLPELLPKDIELTEVLETARRKIFSNILLKLQVAREKGLTWKDLDLETVAWSILVLVENATESEIKQGISMNYLEMARVICRMVMPPEALERIASIETNND